MPQARTPSSFGQRSLDKSVSMASRSSGGQINRFHIQFLRLTTMSGKMNREQLSQRSSSRMSSRGRSTMMPTNRADKPSPIPEVSVKSSDNRELFHKQRRFFTNLIVLSINEDGTTGRGECCSAEY